jgi:hypothetical protein
MLRRAGEMESGGRAIGAWSGRVCSCVSGWYRQRVQQSCSRGEQRGSNIEEMSRSRRDASRDPRRKSPAIPSTGYRRHRTRPPRATSDIFFSSLGTASPPPDASDSRSQQAPPDGTPSGWPPAPLVLRVKRCSVLWLCATPSAAGGMFAFGHDGRSPL